MTGNALARTRLLPTAIVLILLALPGTASAHALGAEAKWKDGRVHVEGYYDDDSPAASAKVWVENEAREKVSEGQTDARGLWSFPAPPAGRYRVTVDAGAGHRATVSITIPAPTVPASIATPGPGPATTDGEPVQISEGPSRAEFTSIPWLRIALGLVVIALLAVGIPRLRRTMRTAPVSREMP